MHVRMWNSIVMGNVYRSIIVVMNILTVVSVQYQVMRLGNRKHFQMMVLMNHSIVWMLHVHRTISNVLRQANAYHWTRFVIISMIVQLWIEPMESARMKPLKHAVRIHHRLIFYDCIRFPFFARFCPYSFRQFNNDDNIPTTDSSNLWIARFIPM